MEPNKRQKLIEAGWSIGDTADFLQLSKEEIEIVEIRLSLSKYLKQLRTQQQLTQVEVAQSLDSSQSRVAKMEANDPSVSIDLLIKSSILLGAGRKDIAAAIAGEL